ncbi:3847_t:CDS:1, partial [Dentiscutata heterogama]
MGNNNIIFTQDGGIEEYINSFSIDLELSKEKILAKYDKNYLNKRSQVPNSFILYRSVISSMFKEKDIKQQDLISGFIAKRWRNEDETVRKWFKNISNSLNQLKNPNHVNKKQNMSSELEETNIPTISLSKAINFAYPLSAYDSEIECLYFID